MSKHITQNAFWVVFSAIMIGLFLPIVSHELRPYTFVFLFIVVFCALMRLPPAKIGGGGYKIKMGKLLLWQLVLTPIAVWAGVSIIGLPAGISAIFIVCSCVGPVFSTPAFSKLMGLDDRFTVQNLLLSTLLMPLSLMVTGYFLLPVQLDLDFKTFAVRVVIFLCVPFIGGYIFRRVTTLSFQEKSSNPILSISTVSLALMACSLMDGIAYRIIQSPLDMIYLSALALSFNLILQGVTTYLFKSFGADFALNAGLVCGYRNWALTLALTAGSLGDDFTTFVAIGQFGVMLLPIPTLRLLKKLIQ